MKGESYIILLFFLSSILFSCGTKSLLLKDHIQIEVSAYSHEGETKASGMPELTIKSKLREYNRRFEFLLINAPRIHTPEAHKERSEVFDLYPDVELLKEEYKIKFTEDENLQNYFELFAAPILNKKDKADRILYTLDELLDVASKFFYCSGISEDTTVQIHVCVAINGLEEFQWEKDYFPLAAFSYEAIFQEMDGENSTLFETAVSIRSQTTSYYKTRAMNKEEILTKVKEQVFKEMRENQNLKIILINHYRRNKDNLPFKIQI